MSNQAVNGRVIIGTRGSPLALWQAHWVQSQLIAAHGGSADNYPIQKYTTSGDTLKGELKEFGGKGLFTRELEVALLDGEIDLAVHSMKDVPTKSQPDLQISAILPRADHRDGFISAKYKSINELPQGALVGTASIRRRAQLSAIRPDVKFCLLRGNVGTRLQKLSDGVCDATFLAAAGLKRLGQEDEITQIVSSDDMLNAPAQGAVGVETRKDNARVIGLLSALNDHPTEMAIRAERGFLEGLDGSCRTPIAALATYDDGLLSLRGEVLALDGSKRFSGAIEQPIDMAELAREMGLDLARQIRIEIGDIKALFLEGDL